MSCFVAKHRIAQYTSKNAHEMIDPDVLQKTTIEHGIYHYEWKRRKAVCLQLIATLSQHIELTQHELIFNLGLDTDEDCVPADTYSGYS